MKLTVGKRNAYGFGLVLLIVIALGTITYVKLAGITGQTTSIANNHLPGVLFAYQASAVVRQNQGLAYKHLGSDDLKDKDSIEAEFNSNKTKVASLLDQYEKTINSKAARDLLEGVRTARLAYVGGVARVMEISRQQTNHVQAYQIARAQLDPAAVAFLASLDAMTQFNTTNVDTAIAAVQSTSASGKAAMGIGVLVALIAGLLIGWGITRSTTKILVGVAGSLEQGSGQIRSASAQVASSSQSLAAGAGEQAASIEETSSSLEEMSSMAKRNAETASKAKELARQTRQAADTGANEMTAMTSAMAAIKDAGSDIAKIIKTIDEIAFQTNILALNAAVEAARAGEAGMGFAVVAGEVRTLAQHSAQAARETADKIEGAIAKTAQGVQISNKVSNGLQEIVTKVRDMDQLVAEVAAASTEQSQGIDQVNSAVTQIDKVTQSNAASAEENSAAAEQLNAQAKALGEAVGQLLDLVGGHNRPANDVGTPAPAQGHTAVQRGQFPSPEVQFTHRETPRQRPGIGQSAATRVQRDQGTTPGGRPFSLEEATSFGSESCGTRPAEEWPDSPTQTDVG